MAQPDRKHKTPWKTWFVAAPLSQYVQDVKAIARENRLQIVDIIYDDGTGVEPPVELTVNEEAVAARKAAAVRTQTSAEQIEDLKKQNAALVAEVTSLKAENKAMKTDVSNVSPENTKLKADLKKAKAENEALKKAEPKAKAEIESLKKDNDHLKAELKKKDK